MITPSVLGDSGNLYEMEDGYFWVARRFLRSGVKKGWANMGAGPNHKTWGGRNRDNTHTFSS